MGAAELAWRVEQIAKASGSDSSVGTVGMLTVHPGASNSIPSQVQMTIDLRDNEMTVRDVLLAHVQAASREIATRRKLESTVTILNSAAATQRQLSQMALTSRAYHDTVFMGQICPIGMIFIPSQHGYSHRPDEYTAPDEIEAGVAVLALALARLAG
jgi:acetylornithine deacetylase/succinyl-diaminopimelate desuccinylase-like protein